MKKICFIMTEASQFNILCRGQLEYFSSQPNLEVTLVCGGDYLDIEKLKSRNIGNVKFIKLVRQPSVFVDFIALIQLFWFFLFNRFDVIVYSTPKALLLGSLASFLTFQNKRIALVRGRAYENFEGYKRKIFELLDKICLNVSHQAIFISNELKQMYLSEKLAHENKSYVIGAGSSNGVDTVKFSPAEIKNNFFFSIIIIGRICFDKGIKDLFEILKYLNPNNLEVKIVGRVEDDESKKILDNILASFSFVKYYEHVDSPAEFFSQADLHLFLSHREGFGNVAIEAASCNVPTFCYDISGLKDSVVNNVSGKRFVFKDYQGIARAINDAKDNQDKFKTNFSNARFWAIENYNQELVWKMYLEFYLL